MKLVSSVASLINPKNLRNISDQKIAEGFLWGVPAVVVPFRQYLDKDRTNGDSKELRYRDLITYTAGPISYFAGEFCASKFLENTKIKPLKNLGKKAKIAISMGTGMTLFMVWATYGAVNLAKALVNHKKPENPFESPGILDKKTGPDNSTKPVEEIGTSFTFRTADKDNPYYLYHFTKYSQSFGSFKNKDPFEKFNA